MLKLYISHFTLLWFFKVVENFDADFKRNIFIKDIVGQNIVFYVLCSKLVVYLVMYFSVSKNLQETTLFYKYLQRSAVDEIDKFILCWQHIIT